MGSLRPKLLLASARTSCSNLPRLPLGKLTGPGAGWSPFPPSENCLPGFIFLPSQLAPCHPNARMPRREDCIAASIRCLFLASASDLLLYQQKRELWRMGCGHIARKEELQEIIRGRELWGRALGLWESARARPPSTVWML